MEWEILMPWLLLLSSSPRQRLKPQGEDRTQNWGAQPGQQVDPTQLQLAYSIKNEGKATARGLELWFKAIPLKKDGMLHSDMLRVAKTDKTADYGSSQYFGPGIEYPQSGTQIWGIVDIKGNPILPSSQEARDYYSGSAIVVVPGKMTYRDFAGAHEEHFCLPVTHVPPFGVIRKGGAIPSEAICSHHNQTYDEYFSKPKMGIPAKVQALTPIKCISPPE